MLCFLPEEQAFWGLTVVVERILDGYYLESMLGAQVDVKVCTALLEQYFASQCKHALSLQVDIGLVVSQWYAVIACSATMACV